MSPSPLRVRRQRIVAGSSAFLAVGLAVTVAIGTPIAASATTPTPPFSQCPAVGLDTSCGILIDIGSGGLVTVLFDASQGPYDGVEDTLIGVQNDSGVSISAVALSGAAAFDFSDGDGVCANPNGTSGLAGAACVPGNPGAFNSQDTSGYGGPSSFFTNIDPTSSMGTVNFIGGLASGGSTYFSLEGAIDATTPITPVVALSTSLSGGGEFGPAISVPANTDVTDSASLIGSTAAPATGTIAYNVFSDSGCNTVVSTGSPETITSPGTFPASAAVALQSTGTYYWQAVYSGDGNNPAITSTCGAEVETVLPSASTTTTTTTMPSTTTTTTTTTTSTTTTTTTLVPSTTTTTTMVPTTTPSKCKPDSDDRGGEGGHGGHGGYNSAKPPKPVKRKGKAGKITKVQNGHDGEHRGHHHGDDDDCVSPPTSTTHPCHTGWDYSGRGHCGTGETDSSHPSGGRVVRQASIAARLIGVRTSNGSVAAFLVIVLALGAFLIRVRIPKRRAG